MAYMLGVVIGSLVATLLFSRLTLWTFKKLGDNERRIYFAYPLAYGLAVILGGLGYADGGSPRFLYASGVYLVPMLLWFTIDLLALKRRRAKGKISN